jgi:predicted permease
LKITKEIMLNPLILAVIVSIPFSLIKFRFPDSIETTGNYLAEIALPLALLGIGGSINIKSIKEASGLAFGSVVIKNIVSPLIATVSAFLLGIEGVDLGLIFIIFACPTAIVSFIMAATMKGNIRLAGNIVIISTLGSLITMTLGLFILRFFHLI